MEKGKKTSVPGLKSEVLKKNTGGHERTETRGTYWWRRLESSNLLRWKRRYRRYLSCVTVERTHWKKQSVIRNPKKEVLSETLITDNKFVSKRHWVHRGKWRKEINRSGVPYHVIYVWTYGTRSKERKHMTGEVYVRLTKDPHLIRKRWWIVIMS